MSPRKSPAKNRVFHTTSTKAVSFTPEKTKQPPRAWERRPATPFIPRDDKKKIWKRVPLGEIGIESNRPINISRRDQENTKDYVRVIKKLKVGHGSDDEDKENVSFGARTDVESADLKRRTHLDSRAVTMRMEEDDIVGSPKKKLRALPNECVPSTQEDAIEEHEACAEAGEDGSDYGSDSEDSSQQDVTEEQAEPSEQEMTGTENEAVEDMQPAAGMIDASCPRSTTLDASQNEQRPIDTHRPGETLIDTTSHDSADVASVTIDAAHDEEPLDQTAGSFEPELPNSAAPEDQDLLSQTVEVSALIPASACEEQNIEMEVEHVESLTAVTEEPRSSSPPTILAENVVIDELESRNAAKADELNVHQSNSLNKQREEHEFESQEAQESVSRRISDDEAAFLRNFVSNSKAERAAREKKAQDTLVEEPNSQQEDTTDVQAEFRESFEGVPQVTEETPLLEPTAAIADNSIGSPLRRSKRAAITSIPRPQTLPNAIQLKRANGAEFIFTANKASSVANIAVVTRSNTKRNKGSALNVPQRLEQLLADEEAIEDKDKPVQTLEADNETSDKLMVENSNEEPAAKKRKREGKDGGIRVKKVLRWNDEKLVSYQEAESFLDRVEDIDDSSQENLIANEREIEDSDKHVKLTLTLTSSVGGPKSSTSSKSSTKEHKDSSSSNLGTPQSKVRRVRRGTSGTVNGTPGPKTRSRRITDDDDKDMTMDVPVDDNGSLENSTAAAAAISDLAATADISKVGTTGLGKRSRMPMPVASGTGVRKGGTASATSRSGSATTRAGAVAVGPTEAKKGKETSRSQLSRDDAHGDLLGKRRLRVRS